MNGNVDSSMHLLTFPTIDVNMRDNLGRSIIMLTILGEAGCDAYHDREEVAEIRIAYQKSGPSATQLDYAEILSNLLQHNSIRVNNMLANYHDIVEEADRGLFQMLLNSPKTYLQPMQIGMAVRDIISMNSRDMLKDIIQAEQPELNLNLVDTNTNLTPLGFAITKQSAACVKVLLDQDEVMTEECEPGRYCSVYNSPSLHCKSAMSERYINMKTLTSHPRTKINRQPGRQQDAVIHRLAIMPRLCTAGILNPILKRPEFQPNLRSYENHVLDLCCYGQNINLMKELFKLPGTYVNEYHTRETSPMIMSPIVYSKPIVLRLYLEAGADPPAMCLYEAPGRIITTFSYNAMQMASDHTAQHFRERLCKAKLLIDAGAAPRLDEETVTYLLHKATKCTAGRQMRMLDTLSTLIQFSKRPPSSLQIITRARIYQILRRAEGPSNVHERRESLIKTYKMPIPVAKFLRFC